MILVAGQVEVTHTELAKETGMEAVHVGAMVRKTTSLTTATGMFTVLANTAVTGTDMATKLPGLFQSGYL